MFPQARHIRLDPLRRRRTAPGRRVAAGGIAFPHPVSLGLSYPASRTVHAPDTRVGTAHPLLANSLARGSHRMPPQKSAHTVPDCQLWVAAFRLAGFLRICRCSSLLSQLSGHRAAARVAAARPAGVASGPWRSPQGTTRRGEPGKQRSTGGGAPFPYSGTRQAGIGRPPCRHRVIGPGMWLGEPRSGRRRRKGSRARPRHSGPLNNPREAAIRQRPPGRGCARVVSISYAW
jgi:hypothetical protein